MRRFNCLESCGGKCCSMNWDGEAQFVFLTEEDTERIEERTGLPRKDFSDVGVFDWTRFSKEPVAARYLRGGCMFFKEGKCGIYGAHPTQCRTFPFWPELMLKERWDKAASSCPGIGQGTGVPTEDIVSAVTEQRKADKEYGL